MTYQYQSDPQMVIVGENNDSVQMCQDAFWSVYGLWPEENVSVLHQLSISQTNLTLLFICGENVCCPFDFD